MNTPLAHVLRRFRDFVQLHDLIAPQDRLVVGCSGGPDSVALLCLLFELNRADNLGLTVYIAHLNHCLRGDESDQDEQFVRELGRRLNAPVEVDRKDLRAIHQQTEGSLEEVARQERFKFFQRVAYRNDAKKVALAHHADDNAETILHRALRGTGLRGLAGIPIRRELFENAGVEVIRPMLSFTRQEIQQYLAAIQQPFREDSSNVTPNHTRNRIRQQLLPLIAEKINPRVVQALLRLGEQAALANEYLTETAKRTFETLIIDRGPGLVTLNRNGLLKKSIPVQAEVVRQAILTFGLGEQDIGYEHIRAILKLAQSTGGRRLDMPGTLRVACEYNHLVFMTAEPAAEVSGIEPIELNVPGEAVLRGLDLRVRCSHRNGDIETLTTFRVRKTRSEEIVDASRVVPPLVLRSRKEGDRFWPLGAPGSKKLTEFFSDKQVESWQRDRVPILCDALGPVWVIPYRIDERVKVTRSTRQLLHISCEPVGGEGATRS